MRINRFWISVLATILLNVSLVVPAIAAERHTLWRFKGQENTVYLLGSVHVLKKSDYPLAAPIEAAFSNASVVAFETDIAALEDPNTAIKLMTKGQLPAGETLSKQLSPETYKKWTKQVAEMGLPAEMFDQFSPGMASL